MYIRVSQNKTIELRLYFTLLFALLFVVTYGQKNKKKANYETVYAIEFKQIKESSYNIKLISLSEIIPEKNIDIPSDVPRKINFRFKFPNAPEHLEFDFKLEDPPEKIEL